MSKTRTVHMLLNNINTPQDLKKIPVDKLPQLAEEIRQRIIEVVCRTGGHLASSLGVVDLTIALHYCLNTPEDKIVWDVGHQSYAHKILTSRNKEFEFLRQYQGLSGFPSKDESKYDSFTTGHSSTAVSLALGLACARDYLPKEQYYKVAAVIGDGSLSGGLCFEGLNNAGHLKKDLLVILNTNEMSIAPNAGALSIYINKIISLPIYNRFRKSLEGFVSSRIPKGSRIIKLANKFEEGLKGLFVPGMLFEELGFRYFGPLDGNNINALIPTLKNILSINGPVLLHVVTKKGKGYLPAENDPVRFHSAGPFEVETGKPVSVSKSNTKTYTEFFSEGIVNLARKNKNIVAITAAMPEGTGLDKFRDAYPDRFFDVGIAEEHAVCFAAGLARQGLIPVVAIYSTFLQRAYDQIIEAVALQNLNVVFVLDRAGIVGDDGATHQGIFDIAYLRNIPNLVIMAPKDGKELIGMLDFAVKSGKPASIRYPKSLCPEVFNNQSDFAALKLGKAEVLKEGKDFAIISLGSTVAASFEAMQLMEEKGFNGTLINARFAKPLDKALLEKISKGIKHIFTIEEGVKDSGFGSAVMEVINKPVIRLGVENEFIPCGKREIFLDKYGLTKEAIAEKILKTISSASALEEVNING
ncbi:MAG: 1-deoxy-D-xylulose-5-phosphate synthase [Candidatus Omnitrophota bacterium]